MSAHIAGAAVPSYRPYHGRECPARDPQVNPDECTCGGLREPLWEPGDGLVSRLSERSLAAWDRLHGRA